MCPGDPNCGLLPGELIERPDMLRGPGDPGVCPEPKAIENIESVLELNYSIVVKHFSKIEKLKNAQLNYGEGVTS